jgi:ribosomal protein S1
MICPYCATPLLKEVWICHECGEILEADSSSDQRPLIESKWQIIRRQCGFQFKARVYRSNNGGLLVNLYTVRGFVPLAQLFSFSDKERTAENLFSLKKQYTIKFILAKIDTIIEFLILQLFV